MLGWRTLNGTPGTRSALVCSTQQIHASLLDYKLSDCCIVNLSNLAAKHLLQLKKGCLQTPPTNDARLLQCTDGIGGTNACCLDTTPSIHPTLDEAQNPPRRRCGPERSYAVLNLSMTSCSADSPFVTLAMYTVSIVSLYSCTDDHSRWSGGGGTWRQAFVALAEWLPFTTYHAHGTAHLAQEATCMRLHIGLVGVWHAGLV